MTGNTSSLRWTTTAWCVRWSGAWSGRGTGLAGMGRVRGRAVDDPAKFFIDFNRRIVAASDEFYGYTPPTDFRLEKREVKVFSTREVPDPKLEAKVKGTFAEFLRFTAPVKTPYPGKQSGECALVSGVRTARDRTSAALERGRDCLCQPVQSSEHDGHRGVAADDALSRYPHAGRDQPRGLCGLREHWAHTRCGAAGGGGCPLLSRLAGAAGLQQAWGSWARVWGRAMRSSRRRTIRAFEWRLSIMLPLMLPMWCGMGSRRGISGRGWNRRSLWRRCGNRGWR